MTNLSVTGQSRSRYLRWALAALALLLMLVAATAALRGWLPFIYAPGYTPQTMTTIPTQRTTHCIGRYLITLPSNFELITGGWGDIELYYGLDKNFQRVYATVKPGNYTNQEFWDEVNKRRFGLDKAKNAGTKTSMLLHGEQLNTSSALLRRLGDENYGLSIKTELHVLVGPRYVTLEQESLDYDSEPMSRPMDYQNIDPTPAETRLKLIASKLLPYQTAERAKPGFCMQGVLFDVGQDDETAAFKFRAKDMGDVRLNVDYHAVTGQPSQGLLERQKNAYASYPPFHLLIATLRERKTQLGGDPAEESLTKTSRSPVQHFFEIERRDDQPRTLDRPFFSVAIKTGMQYYERVAAGQKPPATDDNSHYSPQSHAIVHEDADSSLSDDQVLKLWDEIVASVRKR